MTTRLNKVVNIYQAWQLINAEREEKQKGKRGVSDEDLCRHFKKLLGETNKPPNRLSDPIATKPF